MFPPATHITEAIRADLENREINRRAALNIHTMRPQRFDLVNAVRRALAALRQNSAPQAQPVRRADRAAKSA